jgi:hypothetical protein
MDSPALSTFGFVFNESEETGYNGGSLSMSSKKVKERRSKK